MPALQDLSQHIDFSAVNVPVGICEKCRRSSWLADIFNNEKQPENKIHKFTSTQIYRYTTWVDVCKETKCTKKQMQKKYKKAHRKNTQSTWMDVCEEAIF